jgi:uncharacterized protein involved in exopolysaccharide biosynthesis
MSANERSDSSSEKKCPKNKAGRKPGRFDKRRMWMGIVAGVFLLSGVGLLVLGGLAMVGREGGKPAKVHARYVPPEEREASDLSDGSDLSDPSGSWPSVVAKRVGGADGSAKGGKAFPADAKRMSDEELAKYVNLHRARKESLVKRSISTNDLREAQREFEVARGVLDELRLKYGTRRIELELPRSPVTVHEEPEIVKKPGLLSLDRRYEAAAVIQENPRSAEMVVFGQGQGGRSSSKQFFATEVDVNVVKSSPVLSRVVDELGLDKRWGVGKDEAVERLAENVETQKLKGDGMLEIIAKDRDAELSKEIAKTVTQAYRDQRAELENEWATREFKALGQALREAEDRVEEKRKVLNSIVETKAIPYLSRESVFGGSSFGCEEEVARSASMSYDNLNCEKVQMESQIETLDNYSDEQLIEFAAGLNLPENTVNRIKPEYDRGRTELIALKANGLGDRHPRVVAQKEIIEDYRKQLDEGVAKLREVLRAQLELTKVRLARMAALREGRENPELIAEHRRRQAERRVLVEQIKRQRRSVPWERRVAGALDMMAEVSAAKEPFSTFSLHVGDASFRIASAALSRGERPDPERIRPEEFYNAFDYGDPAPGTGTGEPVGCRIGQCRHPVLPGRNLVRIAVRVGAAGRGSGQALRLTVLLDNSGSMEREDRRAALGEAMRRLASLLGADDVVSVIGFARTPRLLADRMDGEAAKRKLPEIVAQTPAHGGTNLEAALDLARDVARRSFDPRAQNRIVLLTDGAANLGNADPEALARRIEALRRHGVAFDAAGFGVAGMNDAMLERLTRRGNGRYYVVDGASDAGPEFAAKLAGAFRPAAENVKVQVRFNPRRVARYRLIGFEKHRMKKEDFRNDAVDAAELAAEECGVALYQVELRPEGAGGIGGVAVRFRDAAGGEMVERHWAIAGGQDAPAFDLAEPAMQLAGLAVLLADDLRGGPLAPLTDWRGLAPVVAGVKSAFPGDARVGELAGMIERVR